jgi:hypothetical protein
MNFEKSQYELYKEEKEKEFNGHNLINRIQDNLAGSELKRNLISHKPDEFASKFTCYKLKKAAVLAALDINLKRMHHSPKRCARNIMELGLNAFPDKLTKGEQAMLFQTLLIDCKNRDAAKIREQFLSNFF